MAVNYEKKPPVDPKDLGPRVEATTTFDPSMIAKDIKTVADSTEKISYPPPDHSQDPIFLAVLTGAVTKHGVEHYSMANEGSIRGRVEALLRATQKIQAVLNNA